MYNENMKRKYWLTIILGVMAVLLTVSLLFVDKKAVGPNGSEVGFAGLNTAVAGNITPSKTWDKISDVLIAGIVASGAIFAVMGLVQWIGRKSFKKVDWNIKMLGVVYVVLALLYVVFEKLIVINHRPLLVNEALEVSFPSTHTLIAVTLALTVVLTLKDYIKNKKVRVALTCGLVLLAIITAASRILAGMHWTTDVLGGLLYGATLVSLYANLRKEKNE